MPALVENIMLHRSMRARQDLGLDPAEYAQHKKLFGCMPIVLIAGDFMRIWPANEISLGDDLDALTLNRNKPVLAEHFAARDAVMPIDTVFHLKRLVDSRMNTCRL